MRVRRWDWQDLAQTTTKDEFLRMLAKLERQMGGSDI